MTPPEEQLLVFEYEGLASRSRAFFGELNESRVLREQLLDDPVRVLSATAAGTSCIGAGQDARETETRRLEGSSGQAETGRSCGSGARSPQTAVVVLQVVETLGILSCMPLRPSPATGVPLDRAMRRSLLRFYASYWESDHHYEPVDELWDAYLASLACVDAVDLANRIDALYGPPVGDLYRGGLERRLAEKAGPLNDFTPGDPFEATGLPALIQTQAAHMPEEGLCALPDEEFCMALQVAFRALNPGETAHFIDHINRVFETVGVAYHYGLPPGQSNGMEFYRTLDPELEARLVEPALRALADPRLKTADKEFRDGLRRVAKINASELDDAVLDFGRAVTEALHALAEATCGNTKGAAAGPLFGLLLSAQVLPEESESLVLSTSKLRNPVEHQRGVPSNTDPATAHAAMGAAATAITYIASFLPAPSRQPVQVASTADDIPF